MDYSKLTPEQLLELLKTQSPEMYGALTTPLAEAGSPFDGEDPMADYLGYRDALKNTIGRGYDPNLIVEDSVSKFPYDDDAFNSPVRPEDKILYRLNTISKDLNFEPKGFTSDDPEVSWGGQGPTSYPIAYDSARYFNSVSDEDLLKLLLNSGQIGAPEFTVDDSEPLFNFDPKEMLDDYESGPDAVDRIIKRNKNFRWN